MKRHRYLRCFLSVAVAIAAGACAPRTHRHELLIDPSYTQPAHAGEDGTWITNGAAHERSPFDEALLSWDVRLPDKQAGVRLEARVRSTGGLWSRWLSVARRGAAVLPAPERDDPIAIVDVDMIVCGSVCDAIAWRVVGVGQSPPDISGVWITTTEIHGGAGVLQAAEPGLIEHDVPHRSQHEAGGTLGGRLCSPTSVAMVLASKGVDAPVLEVAERAYDSDFDLYGNWVNNTLASSELGVPMRVTRIGSWSEARRYLERGPIVVSLPPFHEQELAGAGYSSASGHLIVIAGLDDRGGVIVRDPAHGEDSGRIYRRSQLTRLWLLKNKGTAYVLGEG
ncbi:MAG: C39 family peptidase [Planctomycetota bacterium]